MSPSRTLVDRYELGDLIGAGGSARVYVATDRVLERRVAVKVLDRAVAETADPAAHERFLREARSAARFSHPNAVATYDAGADGDALFIVMEYVDGTSLAHVIANEAPLDDERVTAIGVQLTSALAAAHDVGLVHRDVKPANVLVTNEGAVKLADFGIAHRFDEITSSLTAEGMVVGTRGYLAPEQARGLATSPATDIYAVGTVLFELATGVRATPAPLDAEIGTDPRSIRPSIAPALAGAIATATAGVPGHRFASAAAMRGALTGDLPSTQLSAVAPPPVPPTSVMGRAPTPETMVMPAATGATDGERADGRPWWIVVAMALAAAAIGVAAWAAADDPDDVVTSDPVAVSPIATTEPSPTSMPATPPATTLAEPAPSTAAPTTPPTTTPPPTSTPATLAPATPPELVPGFPDTDDIEQFIDQLRDGRDVAGKQAKKLGDKMRDLLRDQPGGRDRRGDEIEKLLDEIDRWVDKEELDPIIARRAVELIDLIDDASGDEG